MWCKKAAGVDSSGFAKKANLTGLDLDVDELGNHKVKTVPISLSKLSSVVENNVV